MPSKDASAEKHPPKILSELDDKRRMQGGC